MKLRTGVIALSLALSGSAVFAASASNSAAAASTPSTASVSSEKDKVSYAIGMDLGENFKNQSIDINPALLAQGVKDAVEGASALMTPQQREETLASFQKQFRAKQEVETKKVSERNKKEGDSYLAANKAKPGVTALANGLQYRVIEAGAGAIPTDKDIVTVDYEGRLINGTVFDSSYKRGKPVSFPLSDVIPGWKEALKLMKTGSTWEVVIPPSLAYGERGLGGPIGPNETLIFKIKLISINAGNSTMANPSNKTKGA